MNGFVVLNKEEGMSSSFAAGRLRKIYNEKKTGHTGTLDPLAVGVLPVALGKATRFIDFLPDSTKAYVARFRFGETTDTLDITGTRLNKTEVTVTKQEVLQILPSFFGVQQQMPPMYSALSQNGVRLYELARKGIEVERKTREIDISRLELTGVYGDEFEIAVTCSKGTYIRSLIADIGQKQGSGAVMTALQRTLSNGFTIAQARTLNELREDPQAGLIAVDAALSVYPEAHVTEAQASRFSNGGELFALRVRGIETDGLYRVYNHQNAFIGLGELSEDKELLLVKRVYLHD